MKRIKTFLLLAAVLLTASGAMAQNPYKGHLNIFVANDMGRNGYYEQRKIAALMGEMAATVGPECVAAVGDVHHFMGVASTQDPLWQSNFERIYDHPELMIPWLPVLGNHEYRGNTQACLDYSAVSRRWQMPSRYYTKVFEGKGTALRLIFLDTTPLISKYKRDTETYPDACRQEAAAQLAWLDSVLTAATEQWIVVLGHHPIYAETPKDESEREDMQATVGAILRKHKNVAMYINGHIHNFQHIRRNGMDFITNSSASLSRPVNPTAGTVFCSDRPGFSILSANKQELVLRMIDSDGNVLHEVRK